MIGKILLCYVVVVFAGYISGMLFRDRFFNEPPKELNESVEVEKASPAWQDTSIQTAAPAHDTTMEEDVESSFQWTMETAPVADLLQYSKSLSFAEREYCFRRLIDSRPLEFIEALDGSLIPNRNYYLGIALSKVPDAQYIVDFLSRGEELDPRFQLWVGQIFSGWVEQSHTEARAFLVEYGREFNAGPSQYKAMMRSVMRHEGTSGAFQYLSDLYHHRREFNTALVGNLEDLVKEDPVTAANWFLDHYDSSLTKSGLIMSMRRYGEKDPASAAIFAENLPRGRERHTAMILIAKEWANIDPIGVVNWIGGLEPGITRDVIMGTFAEDLAVDFPLEIMGVVSQVDNPRYRKKLISNIVENTFGGNRSAFETALENYDGPGDILNEFRSAFDGEN